MKDKIENKEQIYGNYEDQNTAISIIIEILEELYQRHNNTTEPMPQQLKTDYMILALKLTRSVTATGESEKDSWLDLSNYARLVCRRRTKYDITQDWIKIINNQPTPKKEET